MSMPFYVSPEQLMKDRADFARKGIARGRSVVAVQYADGILFVSENPSQALHKVSEIYDRIAFAAVGRYNEFENLRIAGVRLADMRGYAYDRRDVTGRGLANAYAQTLGTIFSSGGEKPYEVEIFVAEIGDARRRRPALPADLRRPGRRRARLRRDGRCRRRRWRRTSRSTTPPGAARRRAARLAVAALGHSRAARTGCIPPTTSRSPSWTAPAASRASSSGSVPPGSSRARRPASGCADPGPRGRRRLPRRTCRARPMLPGRRAPRGPLAFARAPEARVWAGSHELGAAPRSTPFGHRPQDPAPACCRCQTPEPVIHRPAEAAVSRAMLPAPRCPGMDTTTDAVRGDVRLVEPAAGEPRALD